MIPPPCQALWNELANLRAQVKAIQKSPGYLDHGKPNKADLAEVKQLQAQIAAKAQLFDACLLKNVKPFPMTIAVTDITCLVEQEGGFLQDDEPYVYVAAINLLKVPPNLELTLYGPWEDVNTGEGRQASGPPFWSLDNKTPAPIAKPSDVLFLVAFMENDDGDPKAARALVKSTLAASLIASLGMPRAQLISKLSADMQSALALPTGFPDSDDRIGPVQELVLSPLDLVKPVVAPFFKTLTFQGNGAKYQVSFVLKA